VTPAVAEYTEALVGDTPDHREQVRKAVIEYLHQSNQSNVRGIALRPVAVNCYLVNLDFENNTPTFSLPLFAQMFVTESGKTYWRIEKWNPVIQQTLTLSPEHTQKVERPE
jgi:hypothetical protein